MTGEPGVQRRAGNVETDDLRGDAAGGEPGHNGIEGGDRRTVPDMRIHEMRRSVASLTLVLAPEAAAGPSANTAESEPYLR